MLDYPSLEILRQHHPAWRLLRADHAPLIASFLYLVFVQPNQRIIVQAELVEALEDHLFALRQQQESPVFPKPALDYLNEWAAPEKGWLRKFYRQGTDEPYFDLTPATEKAIAWLGSLSERHFIGTESRLLTLFELLRQMTEGSETDPDARTAELKRKRDAIDAEMARIRDGDIPLLDDTALKDRFLQFMALARELLGDFRQVEHNFRQLDRRVRERITLWDGAKGELLTEIMGQRDSITDSDQGRNFRAFWDFLMSSRRQQELTEQLEHVLALAPVAELDPDPRTRRIHYDWLDAGEHTQRTVADLSRQLRRFLDDQAWLENRRIMDILRGIESKALALRDAPPGGTLMTIDDTAASIELPLERPLHQPKAKIPITALIQNAKEPEIDASALYSQVVVDRSRLARQIRQALQRRDQISLRELTEHWPLTQGLAELLTYLQLAEDSFDSAVHENKTDELCWTTTRPDGTRLTRQAKLPQVVFLRSAPSQRKRATTS
ncbi:hypothetical protein Thiowin_01606 [Thiorhodovibrio winogradskyi]|uniref:DUF3375 domain-containing protein n=1 Tax=Thiorhodovibrio winogradskyi TaxID=77007 RepID=A0ABZ0S818_9GAMM|nr:DUF3375 domain-containing protein [Thiorhodovibrio winogradskyi]